MSSVNVQDVVKVQTTSIIYEPTGDIKSLTLPNSTVFTYTYDNARRLTAVSNNTGERIEYTLNALGNRVKTLVKSNNGTIVKSQTATFDELGRLLKDIGAAGQTTTYAYDANGNRVKVTDPLTDETSYAFDSLNRLIQTTAAKDKNTTADDETVSITYDRNGNETSRTDAKGVQTTYVYNGFGEVIQELSADTGTIVYTRDSVGNITQRKDGAGIVTNYTYDALNRLRTETHPAATAENVTYSYDSVIDRPTGSGELTSITDATGSQQFEYSPPGNIVTNRRTIGGTQYITRYSYDGAKNLNGIVYPSGRYLIYTLDSLGQVTKIVTRTNEAAADQVLVSNVSYLPFAGITGLTYGNGAILTRTYDLDYRPKTIRTVRGGTTLQATTFGWDNVDNLTSINDPSGNQTFSYDKQDRLTKAVGGYGTVDYTYDKNGNRLSRKVTVNSTVQSNQTYTYPTTSNQLTGINDTSITRLFGYSATGNVVNDTRAAGSSDDLTFTYNQNNRIAAVSKGGVVQNRYRYNTFGERVEKLNAANALVERYHYDLAGHLIAVTGSTGNLVAEYIWLGDTPIAEISPAGAITYILTDHLGTPQKLLNSSGALVSSFQWQPFGELAGGSPYRLKFAGQQYDPESLLHYNYQRTYDPSIGRYLENDPIGLNGGMNRFAYVDSNSLRFADPTGETPALVIPLCLANPIACASIPPIACLLTPGCRHLIIPPQKPDICFNQSNQPKDPTPPESKDGSKDASQNNQGQRGNPTSGEPDTWSEHPHGKQWRKYGPNGRPEVDIDFGHDHGQGAPHAHNWDKGSRGPGYPVTVIPNN